MLRTYFLQQWFNLSDPGMEEAFYESPALRRFAGVDLGVAAAPDETTILRFRHLMEQHELLCGGNLSGRRRPRTSGISGRTPSGTLTARGLTPWAPQWPSSKK
jgi:hypothetical protein